MDLPEIEQVMDMVKNETDQDKYVVLSTEVQKQILKLEQRISENQEDTSQLFDKFDEVQHLFDCLQWQTYLGGIAQKK